DALARRVRDEVAEAEGQDRRCGLEALELVRSVPGAEPVSLVVAPKERQLGVGLSVQNAARDPLVGVAGVDLGMKPSRKVLRTANGQAPDPSRTLDEVRVYPEVPEEHLGAAIEGLAVLVVHPDPGARDAPLGDEEAQEPRDVLVHPHPLTRWQVHQRDPVPHGEIAGRHGDVPIRPTLWLKARVRMMYRP